jgi:hypothetical protein
MKAWLASAFIIASSTTLANDNIPSGVLKLTRCVDMTETSTSPADIKRNLGKTLVVTDADIKFRRKRCPIGDQQVLETDASAKEFFLMNKSFYAELQITAPVTIINTSCNMIIVGSGGEVFVEWDGNVYATQRLKPEPVAAHVPLVSK